MSRKRTVLTVGGGGFTHIKDPELDDFCLSFVPDKPNLGYVGWANDDDAARIDRFHERFRDNAGSLSHLPTGATATTTRDWLAGKHMVYFGGGNSARLITALNSGGLVAHFFAANTAGCVLAGVSAGGVCWYDWILSDSGDQGYRPLRGFSLVTGGVCPHYNTEPARRPLFEMAVSNCGKGSGYAVDDGACIVSVDGNVRGFFSARKGSGAYEVRSIDGKVVSDRLPQHR